jgi:hypothetical protein
VDDIEQYRLSRQYSELIETARQFELKCVQKLGRPKQGWALDYPKLMKAEIIRRYHQAKSRKEFIPENVQLLDMLLTAYQVTELCRDYNAD